MLKSLQCLRENKFLLNVDVYDFHENRPEDLHESRPEDLHESLLVNSYVSFAIDFMCEKFDFSETTYMEDVQDKHVSFGFDLIVLEI